MSTSLSIFSRHHHTLSYFYKFREISGDHQNIVSEFRNFCGPSDPELAKKLRPDSIRSKFGIDKVKNSIHCTDLPDDGELEVSILAKGREEEIFQTQSAQ